MLLFRKEYVKPEDLRDGPTESIYKADKKKNRQQFRDVLKYIAQLGIEVLEVGMENQTEPDRTMPVRILGYDAASYLRKVKKKQQLRPVVTLVLNFSDKPWNKPRALSELFPVPEEVEPYFQDYRIHVVDVAYLPDETILRFKSTFRHVAHFFAHRKEGINYKPLPGEIEHLEEFLELLEVFTGDERYLKVEEKLEARQEKGEKVNMGCVLAEAFTNQGIEIGSMRKLTDLVKRKLAKGKSAEVIAEELDEELSVVQEVIEKLREEQE